MKEHDRPRTKHVHLGEGGVRKTSRFKKAAPPPEGSPPPEDPGAGAGEPVGTPPAESRAPAGSSVSVAIRPLKICRTTIKIAGTSSLIMHAWSSKAVEMIEAKQQKKAKGPKTAKDPRADFEGARYRIDEDTDGIPAIALKSCAVEAGMALGLKKTDLRKSFFVCPDGEELVPIACSGGPTMHKAMVRVGMGVADVRYRPEYKNWSCEVPVEFNEELISAEELFNLFDNAGYSVGIGEWRPEKDGPHGRFRVVSGG